MAASEILYDELPFWHRTIGSRKVKAAKTPHKCAITGHEIPAGASYTRVSHLVGYGKLVTTACCTTSCWLNEDDTDQTT